MNEQQGVSPASADGAPALGPWDVGHSSATGGRNLYVRSADGDVYVGVIFEPANAARIVEAMNAADLPLPPFKRRPVLGHPSQNMTGDEDGNTWSEGVGWALSWGCQLTFGRTEGTGVPYVQVSLSDEDRRRGITQRTATRAQVAEFARMLAEQFGEPSTVVPDPRDAEVELLRQQLADALAENARVDEYHTEWQRADAEVTRLRREADEIRRTLAVELNLKPSELDGRETTDLAAELADRRRSSVIYWKGLAERRKRELAQHLADENSAQAVSDRLCADIRNLNAGHDGTMRYITNRLADILDADEGTPVDGLLSLAGRRLDGLLKDRDQASSQRDGLRIELTQLRAKAELASDREKIAAERDVMATALVSMQQILNAADKKIASTTDEKVPF